MGTDYIAFTVPRMNLVTLTSLSITEWPDTGKWIVKLALALMVIAGLSFITGVVLLVAVAVVVVHPPNGSK